MKYMLISWLTASISYSQIASIPVGYNNPTLTKAAQSREMISALVNRPALGNFPSSHWHDSLKNGLLKVAPEGCDKIFTAQSGSEANELAFKAAFMLYRRKQRGEGVGVSPAVLRVPPRKGWGRLPTTPSPGGTGPPGCAGCAPPSAPG